MESSSQGRRQACHLVAAGGMALGLESKVCEQKRHPSSFPNPGSITLCGLLAKCRSLSACTDPRLFRAEEMRAGSALGLGFFTYGVEGRGPSV